MGVHVQQLTHHLWRLLALPHHEQHRRQTPHLRSTAKTEVLELSMPPSPPGTDPAHAHTVATPLLHGEAAHKVRSV